MALLRRNAEDDTQHSGCEPEENTGDRAEVPMHRDPSYPRSMGRGSRYPSADRESSLSFARYYSIPQNHSLELLPRQVNSSERTCFPHAWERPSERRSFCPPPDSSSPATVTGYVRLGRAT